MQTMPSRDWEGGTYSCVNNSLFFSMHCCHLKLAACSPVHFFNMQTPHVDGIQYRQRGEKILSPIRSHAEHFPAPSAARQRNLFSFLHMQSPSVDSLHVPGAGNLFALPLGEIHFVLYNYKLDGGRSQNCFGQNYLGKTA